MTTTSALTANQIAALAALSASEFFEASQIGASANSLRGLAAAGLADRRWRNSSLRGGERWAYRITGRGIVALHKATR